MQDNRKHTYVTTQPIFIVFLIIYLVRVGHHQTPGRKVNALTKNIVFLMKIFL